MIRLWLAVAGLGGAASVGAGAAAAHFADPKIAELLRTGAVYGMVHAAALVAVVALAQGHGTRRCPAAVAGTAFAIGIALFSGSLFALAGGAPKGVGRLAPVGGVALIIGWVALLILALRRR